MAADGRIALLEVHRAIPEDDQDYNHVTFESQMGNGVSWRMSHPVTSNQKPTTLPTGATNARANPGTVGLCGFAIPTLLLQFYNMGYVTHRAQSIMCGTFAGGLLSVLAGVCAA